MRVLRHFTPSLLAWPVEPFLESDKYESACVVCTWVFALRKNDIILDQVEYVELHTSLSARSRRSDARFPESFTRERRAGSRSSATKSHKTLGEFYRIEY